MNSEYLSLSGSPLRFENHYEQLLAEHVLQRYREVWVITSRRHHLAVDEAALRARMRSVNSFRVFSAGVLFQNMNGQDIGMRLLSALTGPGTVASSSPEADSLVEGEANPRAHWLWRPNGLLQTGTHPFAALATHYIAVEPGKIFQREIGELATVDNGKRSQPHSVEFDFDKLGHLAQEFHVAQFSPGLTGDQSLLSRLLDDIFEQNRSALAFADAHHAHKPQNGPKYCYEPPKLTRYGRLIHTEHGEPRIETSFALLHYEKALYEFDSLKRATAAHDHERQYLHGVYCIVALASCLEAVANKLMFEAHGEYPGNQNSTALARINYAGRELARAHGATFNTLGGKLTEFVSMDQIRILRNSFVHANESGAPIDPAALTSSQMTEVSESACRIYLQNLRLTVALVFDQLPWVARPIVTASNVRWLGDAEVP